jgi:hypothetical protein
MTDQLFTYYIENLLVTISMFSGSWAMFISLDTDSCIIGKGGSKSGEVEKGSGWGRGMGVAGFCGPCVFG